MKDVRSCIRVAEEGEGAGGSRGGQKRKRGGSKSSSGRPHDPHTNVGEDVQASLEEWAAAVSAAVEAAASERDVLAVCESVLAATEDDAVSASLRRCKGGRVSAPIVKALEADLRRGRSGRRAHTTSAINSAILQLLLTSRLQNLKDGCERLKLWVDGQFESHLNQDFFQPIVYSATKANAAALTKHYRLVARVWALQPQLEENLNGTSKTRGAQGQSSTNKKKRKKRK